MSPPYPGKTRGDEIIRRFSEAGLPGYQWVDRIVFGSSGNPPFEDGIPINPHHVYPAKKAA